MIELSKIRLKRIPNTGNVFGIFEYIFDTLDKLGNQNLINTHTLDDSISNDFSMTDDELNEIGKAYENARRKRIIR